MNEWEAKYKALLMAIDNPIYIENAERMVKSAAALSASTAVPFEQVFNAMRSIVSYQQGKDAFSGSPKLDITPERGEPCI